MTSIRVLCVVAPIAFLWAGCAWMHAPSEKEKPSGLVLSVAPNGNDSWSGTLAKPNVAKTDGPFVTLERARDEIRKMKQAGPLPAGGVTVELRGGVYERDKAFELTAEDSGTAEAPIVYRSRKGEEVRLVGGKVVTGWKPVTDATVLNRLDEAARGKVLQADLRALGVTDFGQMGGGFGLGGGPGLELFFQDKPMTLARGPNEGFIKITSVQGKTERDVRGTKGCAEGIFTYDGDRPKRWAGEKHAWVLGYWFWDWAEQRHKVESLDPETKTITLAKPYHGYGYRKGQWFYGFNILAELDAPGEWYLDRDAGILYFWPPEPIEKGKAVVSALPTLATLKDTSHVTLRGLTFEACRGTAITLTGGAQGQVVGCTLRNLGSAAVRVAGGTGHRVVGCDIYETADGGISLDGGDRKTLTPAGHVAENNHIYHFGRWNRMYRPGISLAGVGQRAAHNLIHNAPHIAIAFGGNDHLIELNEIHSVCYESNDAGAMYAGRNWTMRGTVIRHNFLHHISGHEGRGCVGVYLDDMYCGTEISGNVFYKVTRAAFVGGGRDCAIDNNIFVDCRPAVHVDSRALGWAHGSSDAWVKEATEKGTLQGIRYKEPPYSERYPKLVTILDEDPPAPRGNVIRRNICQGGKWDEIDGKSRPLVTLEDNFVDEGEHFVGKKPDFSKKSGFSGVSDFQLRDDSPAYQRGFQRIPIEKIGLYQDERRASWPVTHTVRPMPEPPPPPPKKPLRTGPPVEFIVPRATGPVGVDSADKSKAMLIAKGIQDEPLKPHSWAWLAYDDQHLYVAVLNAVDATKPLRPGPTWGQDDAVEVALRDPSGGKAAPIFVLRGYPNGHFESSTEAGAPLAAAQKAGGAVKFAARILDPGHWSAEYRIPFAALGIDPAKQAKFEFNLSVRKTATSLWLMWQGTGACTWEVRNAGILALGR